ncbi:GCG_CRPN prefix-to-repeats domain-containing protein [Rhizobium populisoli]|uniref:GCG_CRPN prefix-to-repeats domain-containing protein n=1 Tax=Rhizobium populisoli TaxID=2859785 RepID=UPI0035E3F4D7
MRKIMLAATLMISGILGGGSANALPFGNVDTPRASNVVTVDYACGRGYHITPRGNCRPNRWEPPPRPRYYSDRAERRDRWERHGPPRRDWRERRIYRQW